MYDTEHKVLNDIYSALGCHPKSLAKIGNGGNNKIFSFLNRGKKFCIKYYFQSAADKGNRLRAEWSFLTFLQKCGFAFCPQPIFKDTKKQFVIMSLIEGKSLNQSHSGAFISSFCNFFNFINSEENRNLGRDLNVASEGAFDASSHIAISEQKFIKLKNCLHVKSASMLYEVEDIVAKIEVELNELLLLEDSSKNNEVFYQEYKCISPSDFGFHNSIIDTKGNINFVDFEYSGWDDPAKLVLDFLLHPAMTNSLADLRFLMSKIEIPRLNSHHLRARCDMVYKSAVLRWTVTLLNIFTYEYQNKKLFIDKNLNISKQQIMQLQKSKKMLTRINGNPFIA